MFTFALQEFIPRGRQAVNDHPGPLLSKNQINVPTEHLLLYRLQNVNISADESNAEFWSVQEIFKDNNQIERELMREKANPARPDSPLFVSDCVVNAEQELYVKGSTAVWTKGMCEQNSDRPLPRVCFTTDTPIQHAFFCSQNFIKSENPDKRKKTDYEHDDDGQPEFGICLIDATSLRVYLPTGEDYVTSLEFHVSRVWSTGQCILLERKASNATVQDDTIQMPQLFSLSHPLNEMVPVLIRSMNGEVAFFAANNYVVVFASESNDLVMLYDNKLGKHFVARLRKATLEEKQSIGGTKYKTINNILMN